MYALGEYWTQMFDYTDRTERKPFWIGYLGNGVLVGVIYIFLSFIIGAVTGFVDADENTMEAIVIIVLIILYLIYWIAGLAARTRRLRDAGFNPWWILLSFIPIASVVVFIMLFFPTKVTTTQYNAGQHFQDVVKEK
ncbi:uncharacterized membrane protein YhaH (DUF805 family) [Weissella uvarum]|uniref:DUF805 domain-containing protein n=1 Tax=Weissella uvarum TaxID=1479233 RepID=UPI0019612F57|nr:DUF805 domain-containing protein [Weissella uvarum]MBM7616625.1 uncharacterized membrane protein YhaH (DUF805 family) [Weissella uvarum]MCM0594917.1 DUF805 domain-containing protein [Weissella uvarum]